MKPSSLLPRSWVSAVSFSLTALLVATLLPASALANRSESKRSSDRSGNRQQQVDGKERSSNHRAYRHQYRKYRHYGKDQPSRGLHDNPDRQPHYIENRLGFRIRF